MLSTVTRWLSRLVGNAAARAMLDREAVRQVDAYVRESSAQRDPNSDPLKVQSFETGRRILDAAPERRARIVTAAFLAYCEFVNGTIVRTPESSGRHLALQVLVSRLLRARLPLSSVDLQILLQAANRTRYLWWLPMAGLLRAVERFAENNILDPALVRELKALHRRAKKANYAELTRIAERIEALLGGREKKPLLASGPFARQVGKWLKDLDTPARGKWQALIQHAYALGARNRPSAKWLNEAKPLVAAVGDEPFADRIEDWLGALVPDPTKPESDLDLVKGLVFMATLVPADRLTAVIGRFCETCYRKVPGWGARSMKLGNACLYALGQMGERGVAELVRVRGRMKYVQARQQLEKALTGAAERAGISVADLEEIALPDFGLGPDGNLTETLGDVVAEISIAGSDTVTLAWTAADGKPRKTVPASVKDGHKDALKELRAKVKEIKGLLSGQRYRLESLYLRGRFWPLAQWRARYLEHPLLAGMAQRLIWSFDGAAAIPAQDGFLDAAGTAFEPAPQTTVSLWHPIGAPAEDVLAWRRRLAALDVTQPFKQAHREIYVLTEAELETQTYSNRFAAHILRQHQFNALCQARGWRYSLQGDFDSHNFPERQLADQRIAVQFHVDPIDTESLSESFIYLYVTTDRVCFIRDGETMDLADVPPLLFSELMRDVDLFVGVASIGNDPEWQDRGPNGAFIDYWHDYGFGELGETAKTRRIVLEELLPQLKIADVCELEDRFLKVRGKKRTYRIHLGSANVQMEPNNQYLCIVPGGRAPGGDKIRLPFEGDGVLSIILSKAFLLAADDRITDRTIVSQIGR